MIRYRVLLKINGMKERVFETSASSVPKAASNAHSRYAIELNMNIANYRSQIKVLGYKEEVCEV
jgi:hypothetical protein